MPTAPPHRLQPVRGRSNVNVQSGRGAAVRWSRIGAAVVTVVAAGALVLAGPGAAMADAYPDVAEPVKGIQGMGANAVQGDDLALWEMEMRKGGSLLTQMNPVQRGNTVLLAGTAGFVIGATGIRMVYAATGSNWDASMCRLPELVREGYALASLGVGSSSCSVPTDKANTDQAKSLNPVSAGGLTVGFAKLGNSYSGGSLQYYCYTVSGDTLTGGAVGNSTAVAVLKGAGGNYGLTDSSLSGDGCSGAQAKADVYSASTAAGRPTSGGVYLIGSSGQTLAQMTESYANVQRDGRCAVQLRDGTEALGPLFQYSESSGVPMTSFQNSCNGLSVGFGGGHGGIAGVKLQTRTPAGSSNAWTTTVDSPLPQWQSDLPSEYPDCYGEGKSCTLTLEKVKGLTVNECFTDDPASCRNWATETAQGTDPTTDDGWEYKCKYGKYQVDLTRCLLYAKAFGTETSPGTITDPSTGNEVDPGTSTGTDTNAANPGNSIRPGEDVGTSTGQCMASWFSTFNPIDWVMTPVKCALKWAFEPREDVIKARWGTLRTKWSATAIGGLATAVGAWSFASPGTGCGGINVPLSAVFGHGVADITILKACAGDPLAGTAQLSSVVIGIAAVLGVIMAVTRALGGVVGARGLGDDGGRSP